MVIKELILAGESKTVEFKEDFPQKKQILKTICAFANRAGGYVIIGVSDIGDVIGLKEELLDDYLDRISNTVHDNVYPMLLPEIYTYSIENKKVVVVQVFPGNTPPYYVKSEGKIKGTYVRVGKTNKIADYEMLQELERRKFNKSFDEDTSREIDDKSVNELINILKNVLGKEVTLEKLENLNLIINVGKIKYFSNAAEVILGRMDNCCIKCARFTGDSVFDFIDKKEYTGDIFSQLNSAIGFIKSHINIAGIISGAGLKRRDVLEIPEEVFREALLNSIIHRDYSISGSDIKVAIYNSRIDIISPGGLPKTITVEEIYAGRSEIRNKVVARVFREAGIIEQWGSGIPRIREACEREGLKLPKLSEDGMFVKLTIYRKSNEHVIYESIEEGYMGKTIVKTIANASTKSTEKSTTKPKSLIIMEEKEKIFQLLKDYPNYIVKEIAESIGISLASTQRRLDELQKEGKIKRIGSKKNGKWKTKQGDRNPV